MTRPWSHSESMANNRLNQSPDEEFVVLRLYVAGLTPRSTVAVQRVKSICERYLVDRYELTIVDLFLKPEEAKSAQIVVAPTLVKVSPAPMRLFVGDMFEEEKILRGLEVL